MLYMLHMPYTGMIKMTTMAGSMQNAQYSPFLPSLLLIANALFAFLTVGKNCFQALPTSRISILDVNSSFQDHQRVPKVKTPSCPHLLFWFHKYQQYVRLNEPR